MWRVTARTLAIVLVCASASLSAATVAFLPDLDSDIQPNTSGVTAYDSFTIQSNAPAGISAGVSTIHTDTYFFTDVSSGINFNFDVTWRTGDSAGGSAGFLNGNTNTIGIGDFDIEGSEMLGFAVSNLNVDISNYVVGSVGGIINPVLTSSVVNINRIRFADRQYADQSNPQPGESIVNVGGSTGTVEWGSTATGAGDNTILLGTNGLTTNETSIRIWHNSDSTFDTDFRLSSIRFRVLVDLQEATVAAPEPTGAVWMFMAMGIFLRRRR